MSVPAWQVAETEARVAEAEFMVRSHRATLARWENELERRQRALIWLRTQEVDGVG